MTAPPPLHCSDHLLQALVEASNCTFILLAIRRQEQPLETAAIAKMLSLDARYIARLVDILIHFGFVCPVDNGEQIDLTPSGIDLLCSQPAQQPWNPNQGGDRLPSYVAFDLLPLRIYSYRRGAPPNGDDPEPGI